MNLSRPFIRRPIATTLLTIGLALAGIVAFFLLPVARLPAVDFPVITVSANMAGTSPADMARTVATPLERTLGAIAGVNEMTSTSSTGSTRVVLQFDLSRDIDGAARDVQAAINAARVDLPANLRTNPTYRKVNPAAQPFMILALTSQTRSQGEIFDLVNNILSQRLLQVPGVGDVTLGGRSQPAVRVELDPYAMHSLGLSGDDVRAALQANNANRPLGAISIGTSDNGRMLQVLTPAPGLHAADYRNLIVGMRDGAEIRLSSIAQVIDSVQDTQTRGMFNGKPAIIVSITQQPDANLIATADAIDALLPQLRAQLPADVHLDKAIDRTGSVRASVHEVEITLVIAVFLVVLVVGLFLRTLRAAVIPAVATVVSLLGTFGVMYALGYSLNNLSLMALTVATGFVVDDAIVVLENIQRHMELGVPRRQAALEGAREVGFTVLTISVSLVAVFIPLLFMGGLPGRFFREFAITLSASILISLAVSLTTTPMLCSVLLRGEKDRPVSHGAAGRLRARIAGFLDRGEKRLEHSYSHALDWSLAFPWLVVLMLVVVIGLSGYLFTVIPKGFFPEQDNGQFFGGLRADQSISSTALGDKLEEAVNIITADPAVSAVAAFTSGRSAGGGFLFASLKSPAQRPGQTTRSVINRLRPQLQRIPGLTVFLNPVQELRMGGRSSNATYQYTLKADNEADLKTWAGKLSQQLKKDSRLTDVNDDITENGVESYVQVDRDRAASLGVSMAAVDAALYNAFGQRQVANMYSDINQYTIVMEWAPKYATAPVVLRDVYVPGSGLANLAGQSPNTVPGQSGSGASPVVDSANPGQRNASTNAAISLAPQTMVPLDTFARFGTRAVPSSVFHDGGELSSTLSFNLADGVSLLQGRQAVLDAVNAIGMPNTVRGAFAGEAAQAQQSQSGEGLLVLAAAVVIYLVLGILYESLIHPLTVLSTLPSAGFGAVVALLLLHTEFSLMSLIGVFLLIGIVKKNAILIIDFALQAERERGLTAVQAAREACLMRFRPILMTTLAAGLGALPLAIGFGQGAELRQPLGITIVGGLIASQFLTLVTTPAIYVLLDRLRGRRRRAAVPRTHRAPA